MLLRFRVANHRSIREEQELSLVAAPRRGEASPPVEAGAPRAVRVAAIYGPNASGKTSIISAIYYLIVALRESYRIWDPTDEIPRQPFLLDNFSRKEASLFELDFTVAGIRYNYGFELGVSEVIAEWLYSYPRGKKRVLFDRLDGEFHFGRSLRGENATTARLTRPNALFLSVAAASSHEELTEIFRYLTSSLVYADSSHNHEVSRLGWLRGKMRDPEFSRDVSDMLRLADLGLVGIELVDNEIVATKKPGSRSGKTSNVVFDVDFGDSISQPPKSAVEALKKLLGGINGDIQLTSNSQIMLLHESDDPNVSFPVPLTQESSGTRSWLSLAGRILFAIRYGETLIVDEIDASLHPKLSATLIHIFKDEEINRRGSQLIFTTHDVSFLGSLLEDDLLCRDEVWFTEKARNGATTLYSLAEFKPRRGENVERGYLLGRYGALPMIDVHEVKRLLSRVAWPDYDLAQDEHDHGGVHVEP
ncbi:AAA family ATPase [Amycolatopsis sp. NBC_00438]|uniref:AAA family ATPase n=1 Tax=Amycolatopsis sp. NBC_00438 TaxID=2903558 RepID=UPI002E2357C6